MKYRWHELTPKEQAELLAWRKPRRTRKTQTEGWSSRSEFRLQAARQLVWAPLCVQAIGSEFRL